MIHRDVELFYEPGQILKSLPDGDKTEMSGRQLAFLCGLMKQERPKKILEIGVSSGATTAVLLNCISMLDLEAEIYSLDLAEDYSYDKSKKVGYVIEQYQTLTQDQQPHTLYTGAYAVEHLDTIGNDIDFLILDTVHRLPGEILDFLACYPYMKQGGSVVLHDITMNHCGNTGRERIRNANEYATKILFDAVVADKFIDIDKNNTLSNIGAFKINDDTAKYIENLFSVLSITWAYKVSDVELQLYRAFYGRHYSQELLGLFDMVVNLNLGSLDKRKMQKREDFFNILRMDKLVEKMRSKKVYIYGCGKYGWHLRQVLEQLEVAFCGFVISDGQKKDGNLENVNYLSDIHIDPEKELILIGANNDFHRDIIDGLHRQGIGDENILFPDEWIYDYLS